jgi:hypothetical protein
MQLILNVHHSLPAAWWSHSSLLRFSARPFKKCKSFAHERSVNVIIVHTNTKIERASPINLELNLDCYCRLFYSYFVSSVNRWHDSWHITTLGDGWELPVSRYAPCWLGRSHWRYLFVVVFSAHLGWFGFFMFKTLTGIQGRDVYDTVYVVSCLKNLFLFSKLQKICTLNSVFWSKVEYYFLYNFC